jgi:hypothetical protein
MFAWNADERRFKAAKKWQASDIIASSQTGPEPVTVPEIRDDSQLTISAFGGSIPPFFVSKNKTFEKDLLVELEMYEGHYYIIRTAPKTFMTKILFIDWLQTAFCRGSRRGGRECTTTAQLSFISMATLLTSLPE